ncbi:MAG: hypothetical protein ACE5DW_02165 [Thermodesulfobacteriota bacterium]
MSYRRFCDCSVSEKLLYTSFITLLGVGYFFAMLLIFMDTSYEDGVKGLSVEDINIKYRGNRSGTRLEQALIGQMKSYRTNKESSTIISWIHAGAPEAEFDKTIKPILTKKCLTCHNPALGMNTPDLSTFEAVTALGTIDTGAPIATLVRVSHIHLFGMAIMFYLLGRIFVLSEMAVWLKRTIVIIPFAAILLDIGSWWFTKFTSPVFAYTVMAGGAAFGLTFVVQSLVSFYQMWFYKGAFTNKYIGSGGEYSRRQQE